MRNGGQGVIQVNRFRMYLRAQKLAKMHIVTAEERLTRGDYPERTLQSLLQAIRELMVANANLASLMFCKKPTLRRKARAR